MSDEPTFFDAPDAAKLASQNAAELREATPQKGELQVGTFAGEVIINHPDLDPDKDGVYHIVFSPEEARVLARILFKQADIAEGKPHAPSTSARELVASDDLWCFVEDCQETVNEKGRADWVDLRNLIRVIHALKVERDALAARDSHEGSTK